MSKKLNTQIKCLAPGPLEKRTQVVNYADLSTIPIIYNGLKVYVSVDDKEYRYYLATGWKEWSTSTVGGGGDAVWGSITGVLSDQTDVYLAISGKFDKTGGTITGDTFVQSFVEAENFIIRGSTASSHLGATGTFTASSGELVTVESGIITSIV